MRAWLFDTRGENQALRLHLVLQPQLVQHWKWRQLPTILTRSGGRANDCFDFSKFLFRRTITNKFEKTFILIFMYNYNVFIFMSQDILQKFTILGLYKLKTKLDRLNTRCDSHHPLFFNTKPSGGKTWREDVYFCLFSLSS